MTCNVFTTHKLILSLITDEVKTAERVLVDEIPLPEIPIAVPLAPYDIPLPQPKSILKRSQVQTQE